MMNTGVMSLVVRVMVCVALIGAAGGGGGCATLLGETNDPTLDVVEARVGQVSEDGVVLRFVVEAYNGNDVDLPLRNARYALELDGQRVFEGVRSPEATLRRQGMQAFELPAAVELDERVRAMMGREVRWRLSGVVYYSTPGALADVLFDTNVRRPKVSFAEEGVVKMSTSANGQIGK